MDFSKTPQTDKALKESKYHCPFVLRNLCYNLELERNIILEQIDKWRNGTEQEIRLRAGELTSDEIRTIKAILSSIVNMSALEFEKHKVDNY